MKPYNETGDGYEENVKSVLPLERLPVLYDDSPKDVRVPHPLERLPVQYDDSPKDVSVSQTPPIFEKSDVQTFVPKPPDSTITQTMPGTAYKIKRIPSGIRLNRLPPQSAAPRAEKVVNKLPPAAQTPAATATAAAADDLIFGYPAHYVYIAGGIAAVIALYAFSGNPPRGNK